MATLDAHQHYWSYDPAGYSWIVDNGLTLLERDFLPDDLAPQLAAAGVEGSLAVQARCDEDETRWLLSLAEQHEHCRGVVGWVDLTADDVGARLDALAHPKLVGVRHIAQDEPDDAWLARDDVTRGVAALGERGLVYDLLVFPRQIPAAARLVSRLPHVTFVLDHLAKPPMAGGELRPWSTDVRRLAAFPNVSCKLSGMVTEARWDRWHLRDIEPFADVVLDAFGPRRLLYGSDWPVCTLAADYAAVHDLARALIARLSPSEQEAVMGLNAARVYGLGDREIPHSSTFTEESPP